MAEVNLLKDYPKTVRNPHARGFSKTSEDQQIARQFGREFFDGDRRHGYGGFSYHPRFWQPVIPAFQKYYNLSGRSKILDVGCAKGFMLFDFQMFIPGISVSGVDISSYAIENAKEEIKPFLKVADAKTLPFKNREFDLVISINTLHNLEGEDLQSALREIQRVTKEHSFISVDGYQTEEEKERLFAWNLTAKTILHVREWEKLFKQVGYTGDYYWFTP